MKKIFVSGIQIYQKFISPVFKNLIGINASCRYDLTCSEFTKQKILKEGVLRGSILGLTRIATCNPLFSK